MTQPKRRTDPFKVTRRSAWRIGLANAVLADKFLDGMIEIQNGINATMSKIATATPSTLPTDFSLNKIGKIEDWGILKPVKVSARPENRGHAHRQSFKWALLHALYSLEVTNDFFDMMDHVQQAHDALCDKLDAQAGILTDTDFNTLVLEVLDADKEMHERSKASFRGWLLSSLSSYGMTEDYIGSITSCQETINAILVSLDSGSVSMPESVNVLDPKAKIKR